MTKTQYAKYIGSAEWQQKRKEVLKNSSTCTNCEIPRWLAEIAYDQDLHVHHVSYSNVGNEQDGDLEPLCRRCHEFEKFGRSELREPKSAICTFCSEKHWDYYSDACEFCRVLNTDDAKKVVYSFDNYIAGCSKITVSRLMVVMLILHYEGIEGITKIMKEIEPFLNRDSLRYSDSQEFYEDVPF